MEVIEDIVSFMIDFQSKRNIKNKCMDNSQMLYKTLKANSDFNVCVKAKYLFGYSNEVGRYVATGGHLVLEIDGKYIFDPSCPYINWKNKVYCDDLKTIIKLVKLTLQSDNLLNEKQIEELLKYNRYKFIDGYVYFSKIADRINNGGFCITDKDYYSDLIDYVNDKL
jgi:hypothetical protein